MNAPAKLQFGGAEQFWAYTSPQNNTDEMIKDWKITISQGSWSDSMIGIVADSLHPPTGQYQCQILDRVECIV